MTIHNNNIYILVIEKHWVQRFTRPDKVSGTILIPFAFSSSIHLTSRVIVHARVHEVGTLCTDLLEVELSLLPAKRGETDRFKSIVIF